MSRLHFVKRLQPSFLLSFHMDDVKSVAGANDAR